METGISQQTRHQWNWEEHMGIFLKSALQWTGKSSRTNKFLDTCDLPKFNQEE
jgi:hypothetical protein